MSSNKAIELLVATKKNNLSLVEEILKNNPKLVNTSDSYENTPVLIAVENGNYDMVKLFTDLGANIYHTNIENKNAYSEGIKLGNEQICSILNKISVKFFQERTRLAKNKENPFAEYDLPDFVCWDVTNAPMPFQKLKTSLAENGPIIDADQVRSFMGVFKAELMVERIFDNNKFQQPISKKIKVPVARAIIIDLLPLPYVSDYSPQEIRKVFLSQLKAEESFKVRKSSLESYSICYFADYDVESIINKIADLDKIE
jgi:hypothetical protein